MLYIFSIQAISKWENNQDFPETEKLLLLSNIFEVSADFLLKDERTIQANEERGYYVSKEMERGFIATQSYYWNIRFYVFTWCYGTYELPVKNDEYSKRFFFKLRRKIRKKVKKI